MDGNRFDDLARRFAGGGVTGTGTGTGTGSRRSLLKAALAGVAAAVAGVSARDGAEAQACRQVADRCTAARPCCAGLACVGNICAPQQGQPACGGPGTACGGGAGAPACCPGTVCAGGVCCPAALACGGACCAGSTVCVRGVCQSPTGGTGCPAGQTRCGTAGCRNLTADPANCGSCGRVCSGGVCTAGVCGAGIGAACTAGGDCLSGFCLDGVCCAQGSCAGFDGPCAVGVCQAGSGQCASLPKANGTGCGPGDACTPGATCQGGACIPGTSVTCPPLDPDLDARCATVSCDTVTGCGTTFAAEGTSCDTVTRCDGVDACDGAGRCVPAAPGQTVTCPPCQACNPATGACDPADDGLSCLGFQPCATFACSGGVCVPTSTCGPCEFCRDGRCQGGPCDACDNRCNSISESCVEGVCKTNNGFSCAVAGDCRSGFCVRGTCCNSACTGTCESCNATTDRRGTCFAFPKGSPCGTGSCNAAGICCPFGPNGDDDPRCGGNGACCADPAAPCCPGAGCCPTGACFGVNDASLPGADGYLCCGEGEGREGTLCGNTCCIDDDVCFGNGCVDPVRICDDGVNPEFVCAGPCCPLPGGGTTCCGAGQTCTAAGCLTVETAVCTTDGDCAAFGASCVGWTQFQGVRNPGSGRCCASACPIDGPNPDGPYEVCCTGNTGCCEGRCRSFPDFTCSGCLCSFRSITGR